MKTLSAVVLFCVSLTVLPLVAQPFSSGSTGADGALDLATLNCETGPYAPGPSQSGCSVPLPESGILNYTTINVPLGKALNFKKNRENTPVVLLAQGNVFVGGTISVDGVPYAPDGRIDYAQPGPGGFPGAYPVYVRGLGPGGGTPDVPNGRWVGPLSLVPIVGGSGGLESGGGGAIVIASSGEIRVDGVVTAMPYCRNSYGIGSGGAVRLVANQIIISAAGKIWTQARCDYGSSYSSPGIIRLEAPNGAISYAGSTTPAPIISTVNPAITASVSPQLRIVSVGGFLVSDYSGTRKDAADLVLPKQMPDPINVVVEATNIPVGSPVTISFGTSNQGTAASVPLAGSFAQSTATIGVSGLNRDQLAYLYVQVLFEPPPAGARSPAVAEVGGGVARVRLTSALGAKPKFVFLRSDGTEVPVAKLPPNLKGWISQAPSR